MTQLEQVSVPIHKEDARLVIPVSTATERTWWINVRALRDFFRLRLAKDAECGYRERQVGKIVETNYLGDYEWELTAEVDEDMVMNYFGDSIGFISMGVTNPDPLLNEYAEESEVFE